MLLALLLLLLLFSPRQASAQIPLYYQLLEAYHPATANFSTSVASAESSTPALTAPAVLGVSTSVPPVVITSQNNGGFSPPRSIGGDGKVVTVAVLGDSMVDTMGASMPALKKALTQYFPSTAFNLLNYGYGSRDIEWGLHRLTNDYEYLGQKVENLISQSPDIIVVESFAYNNFGNTESGTNRHWLALGAITSTIRQKLPNSKIVIAAAIAPNSVVFGNGIKDLHFSSLEKIEKTSTIKVYLQNAVNFATSQGFPLADAYHLSLVNNDGSREFINSSDNLHPNSFGQELFADVVADAIFKNKLID